MPDFLREWYATGPRSVRELLLRDWDFVTAIAGYEGTGKSTLGLHIAMLTDPDFDPATQLAFEAMDYLALMKDLPPGKTLIFDEAVQGAYARNHSNTENKQVNVSFMIARAKRYHHILCIPNFYDLDPMFRNRRVRARFDVKNRGRAIAHVPELNAYSKDDAFWRPVATIKYNAVTGAVWGAYQKKKEAYIEMYLNDLLGRNVGEDVDSPQAVAAQLFKDRVAEVTANALWDTNEVMARYNCAAETARKILTAAGRKPRRKGRPPKKQRENEPPIAISDEVPRGDRRGTITTEG